MAKTNKNFKRRVKKPKTKRKVMRKNKKTLRLKHKKRSIKKGGNCNVNPLRFASYPLSESGGSLMELPISTRRTLSGGSGIITKLMPQDLVNFGRSIQGGFTELVNDWSGTDTQPNNNPMPTSQPIDNNVEYIGREMPIDVLKIHSEAGNKVAAI